MRIIAIMGKKYKLAYEQILIKNEKNHNPPAGCITK